MCIGSFFRGRRAVGVVVIAACVWTEHLATSAETRPNILWITAEDISPDLGCYGDDYAITPTIDRLASEGVRFDRAFSICGVCAPSRSAIITGMYPASIGTHHMRCKGVPPAYVKCFSEYLRAAGYYCTNMSKTDYNFDAPITAWDESSSHAHWRKRPAGKPFFSVFNLHVSHESQIRRDAEGFAAHMARVPAEHHHDPDDAIVPPYYPDTPITRRDWANYYDLITAMDLQVADLLQQLEDDGLADNTIVFFYGDHGRGLPRAKRWIYDSGLRVPLIIRWPGTLQPGTADGRLVSFIDFGPTVLSMAGVKVPEYMQGRPFLGDQAGPPREYVHGERDRMDETYDLIRCVRDKRYKYIRNFQPGKPYAQYIGYMELMPTMQEMRRLNKAGMLFGAQRQYFLPEKPAEELYDVEADPHEINNVAGERKYADVLQRMRSELERWMQGINDLGLVPEDELNELRRPGGVWETTATPTIDIADGVATISCPTEGASIAYQLAGEWQLYSEPVPVKPGDNIRALACRLGYRDSQEAIAAIPAE